MVSADLCRKAIPKLKNRWVTVSYIKFDLAHRIQYFNKSSKRKIMGKILIILIINRIFLKNHENKNKLIKKYFIKDIV